MGLFGKKKKAWDEGRIQENKAKMRALFEQVVEDAAGYQLVYAYSSSIKTSNYILARKTTYTYTSLIVGFREEYRHFTDNTGAGGLQRSGNLQKGRNQESQGCSGRLHHLSQGRSYGRVYTVLYF